MALKLIAHDDVTGQCERVGVTPYPLVTPKDTTITVDTTVDGASGQTTYELSAPPGVTIGDIKSGVQASDHNGWILLDGRALGALTPTQQANMAALGLGAVPDTSTGMVLRSSGAAIGTIAGADTASIAKTNLPNVQIPLVMDAVPDHDHGIRYRNSYSASGRSGGNQPWSGGGWTTNDGYFNIVPGGAHTPTGTTQALGSGTPLGITPRHLVVNFFIFMGTA